MAAVYSILGRQAQLNILQTIDNKGKMTDET